MINLVFRINKYELFNNLKVGIEVVTPYELILIQYTHGNDIHEHRKQ